MHAAARGDRYRLWGLRLMHGGLRAANASSRPTRAGGGFKLVDSSIVSGRMGRSQLDERPWQTAWPRRRVSEPGAWMPRDSRTCHKSFHPAAHE